MKNTIDFLKYFKDNYLDINHNAGILNIGYSKEKNFKDIFDESNWSYSVLDNLAGNFVDLFVEDIYSWGDIVSKHDVIICDNILNSLSFFWLLMNQMEKNLNSNGYLCVSVENKPLKNEILYNFSKDSLIFLANYVNLDVIEFFENDSSLYMIAKKHLDKDIYLSEVNELTELSDMNRRILKEYDEKINALKKSNLELTDSLLNIRSIFMDTNILDKLYCPICKTTADNFESFGNPPRINAKCPNCGSLERDRFIYLFLSEQTNLFIKNHDVLDFAPSASFYNLFNGMMNINYSVSNSDISKINLKDYEDNSFDTILNFHILDKVADDSKFLKELYRIVKPEYDGGFVLINVPLLRDNTFEDKEYNTPELRKKHYHDENRFRIYGKDFKDRLIDAGFNVEEYSPDSFLSDDLIKLYGIQKDYLYLCTK